MSKLLIYYTKVDMKNQQQMPTKLLAFAKFSNIMFELFILMYHFASIITILFFFIVVKTLF